MAPTSGVRGMGLRSGPCSVWGTRASSLYRGDGFNSINLWLSMVNHERKLLFYQAGICDNIK
jgi:hypothetical protein